MAGLTFLHLSMEAVTNPPLVAGGDVVIQTPSTLSSEVTSESKSKSSSGSDGGGSDQVACLVCLQGVGVADSNLSSNRKLSAIDFCNLLQVSVPSLSKSALRKSATPFCEICFEDVVRIRGLLNEIEELGQSLIVARNLVKDKIVANYGTQDCDTRGEVDSVNALTGIVNITYNIRNSIHKDVSERASHVPPITSLTNKKRGRKPGKKLPTTLQQIPETESPKEFVSRKSSFGRVVKRPRYFMMSDEEGGDEMEEIETKHDTDFADANASQEIKLAADITTPRIISVHSIQQGENSQSNQVMSSKPGAHEQANSIKIKPSKGNQSRNVGKGRNKKRPGEKLKKGKSKLLSLASVSVAENTEESIGNRVKVEPPTDMENVEKLKQEIDINNVEQLKKERKEETKMKKSKVATPKQKLICEICNRIFSDIRDRNRHMMRIHEGLHPDFECKGCDKTFNDVNELRRHRELRHPPKEPMIDDATGRRVFQCDFCKTLFKHYYDLQIHRRIHTGEKPFKCQIDNCKEAFISKGRYEVHVEMKHPAKAPLKCEFCPRGFFRRHRLRAHKKSHTGERPYLCEICSKAFSQPAYLKYHQTKHQELNLAEFKCDECDKKFASPVNLRFHRETQHQKKYRYHCTVCGYGATYKSHLRQHMLDHTGERPHICTNCQKSFKRGSQLKIHMRSHTGERPYSCLTCNKGFTNSSRLRRHELIHAVNKIKRQKGRKITKGKQSPGESQQNPELPHASTTTLTAETSLADATTGGILLPTDLVDVQVEEDTNGQAVLKLEHVQSTLAEQDIQQQLITIQEQNGVTYQIIATDDATGNEPYTEYILINSNYTFT